MKKKLKILFLAPSGSSHSYKWINSFSKKHDISWFYIDPLKFHISKIKFYNLNNYSYKLFLPIIFFFKVFLLKPDIIHVHSISKNLFISFLAVIFFKKKIILHPWGSDVIFSNFFVRILQFFITNNIIFTNSHIIRKKFLKKNKVFKINFGVDLEYFKKTNLSILSKKKKLIFCPRGYDPLYNQFLIIKFIKKNISKLNNFNFIFSGTKHDKEFKLIYNYVKKYDLNSVINLKGQLKKEVYKKYLLQSFLVISASRSDAGLSSSIAEAMSANCLVLCTNNRDNPYWIKNNINGFLFKDNDLKDLEKKFFYITNISNKKYLKISERSRQTQKNFNNLSIEMLRAEKIYKKIHKHSCFN